MKISLDWLKEYIEVSLPPEEICAKLNMIGLVVESVEEREGDLVLDIETYANRPDTLGHLGIAREIGAALHRPLAEKTWPLTELPQKTSDCVDIQIWDEDLCPRYCGILVKGVRVGASPEWLRRRIEAMGLKPINNIVDITNYVLFATAQPIHAFDFAKVEGAKIIIRKASKGETLQDLEGRILELSPPMLVIADENKPVALAGVIGGEASGVTEETRDVFIESAHFNPVSIRLTAKHFGLSTDAAYRFERGTDVSFPPDAALMAASLMAQSGEGVTRGILDVFPLPPKRKSLVLRHRRIGDLLGVDVPKDFVDQILEDLGFEIEDFQNDAWRVGIPSFRVDIDREADLIEEVARFYGYDRIPSEVAPIRSFDLGVNKKRDRLNRLREALFHQGFDEVINFSFADPEREALIGSGRMPVSIQNPLSARASLLRTNLYMGLLENASWNLNRGAEGVHIFETGNVFVREGDTSREILTLGILSIGKLPGPGWQEDREETDFFVLKGACEALMADMRYEPYDYEKADYPTFEAGQVLNLLYKGQAVGRVGALNKTIRSHYALDQAVFVAEIDLDALFGKQSRAFLYSPVPKFPGMSRDLSFLVDKDISFRDIQKALDKLSIPLLEGYELYDRFTGRSIPSEKVSLSLRFRFRNPKRTLLAEEIDSIEEDIIGHLKTTLGIQMREGKIDI